MFKLQNGYINPKYIVSLYDEDEKDLFTVTMINREVISLTKEEYEELSKL